VVPLTWKLPYFKEKESKNRSQFLWRGKNYGNSKSFSDEKWQTDFNNSYKYEYKHKDCSVAI
jgi:hypothetical protein